MEINQELVKERDREKGLPDLDPMTGLPKDNDGHNRLSKSYIPGGLEHEDEAESRTSPPRPRSPDKVCLGVEVLGVPITRVPLGDNLHELSEQIELATKKLEEMKKRGAVTSALQKRWSLFCEEILMEPFRAQGEPVHKQDPTRRSHSRSQERNRQGPDKGKRPYESKEKTMIAYLERVKQLIKGFEQFQLHQVPRAENGQADALAKFASNITGVSSRKVVILTAEEPKVRSEKDPIGLCPTADLKSIDLKGPQHPERRISGTHKTCMLGGTSRPREI
ncbi:hypothetical protein DH2020_003211 [Rehmannia glutinosa]|uniref:RNase H type-1 domain-containing protein n=1 Tax=Rehmannia glutinosa TaxID=99300 RepID=A0ABR0XL39_REHGL